MVGGFHYSPTLFIYLGLRYAAQVALALLILISFIYFLEVIELSRRITQKGDDYSFFYVMVISLFNLPHLMSKVFPFAILFGSIGCFYFWNKSHEFTISRAVGQSIWGALLPAFAVAFALGLAHILIVNPIASATVKQYQHHLESIFGKSDASDISISTSGIWFRDGTEGNNLIIHGTQLDIENAQIVQPALYQLQPDGLLAWRIVAEQMRLTESGWIVNDAGKVTGDGVTSEIGDVLLPTAMQPSDIAQTKQSADTVSIYQLPRFISIQKAAGLSVTEHLVFFHQLVATPLEFVGLAMLAASFTLAFYSRQFKIKLILYGVGAGFGFYFLSDLIYLLGSSARLPYLLAGYGPGLMICVLGGFLLARIDE